ncbi:MAG: hypothetical protein ACKO34_04225 [Vampirovibrionales bacterium]
MLRTASPVLSLRLLLQLVPQTWLAVRPALVMAYMVWWTCLACMLANTPSWAETALSISRNPQGGVSLQLQQEASSEVPSPSSAIYEHLDNGVYKAVIRTSNAQQLANTQPMVMDSTGQLIGRVEALNETELLVTVPNAVQLGQGKIPVYGKMVHPKVAVSPSATYTKRRISPQRLLAPLRPVHPRGEGRSVQESTPALQATALATPSIGTPITLPLEALSPVVPAFQYLPHSVLLQRQWLDHYLNEATLLNNTPALMNEQVLQQLGQAISGVLALLLALVGVWLLRQPVQQWLHQAQQQRVWSSLLTSLRTRGGGIHQIAEAEEKAEVSAVLTEPASLGRASAFLSTLQQQTQASAMLEEAVPAHPPLPRLASSLGIEASPPVASDLFEHATEPLVHHRESEPVASKAPVENRPLLTLIQGGQSEALARKVSTLKSAIRKTKAMPPHPLLVAAKAVALREAQPMPAVSTMGCITLQQSLARMSQLRFSC